MTSRKLYALALLAWWVMFLPPRPSTVAAANADTLIVVVGLTFPGTDISYADLKSAFRAQPVTVGGLRVIPVNHPRDSALRVDFDRVVLGLEPSAVGPFWVDMRIRDQGKSPTTAPTAEFAVRIAAALSGAITYSVKSAPAVKVKVLTVGGKAAGQSGYALQR
jgi:hypothetical protein